MIKKEKTDNLPEKIGVYLFRDEDGNVLYVGKAVNIKKRVKSYFNSKDRKAKQITEKASDVSFEITETVIDALIKEADTIKKYRPPYNIKDNDDRSFLYVVITKEEYPRVLLKRGKDIDKIDDSTRSVFGPFVYASEIKSALKTVRKIFPYSTHTKKEIERGKECFYSQINLCPGVCAKKITQKGYMDNIKKIEFFFKGKRKQIIKKIKKEMQEASKEERYEEAQEMRRRVRALEFILDTVISREESNNEKAIRIEGYDISNISGKYATGSMVVFKGKNPIKEDYRRFKIKESSEINDVAMMKEVVERRLKNKWPLPDLILVDGGIGQVSVVKNVLAENNLKIKVIGLAKGKDRTKREIIGQIPKGVSKEALVAVQDEAHRFAVNYHRKLRDKDLY